LIFTHLERDVRESNESGIEMNQTAQAEKDQPIQKNDTENVHKNKPRAAVKNMPL